MSQGVQLNMLLGSSDIALKADVSAVDGETQEQGLVFGEMLGDIVQPGKKGAAVTLRQLPAGISVLSEVSQALLMATETEHKDSETGDSSLTESLLGQIALKTAKHDAQPKADAQLPQDAIEGAGTVVQNHTAGDEALKSVLLAQVNSNATTDPAVTEPVATEPDNKASRKAAQAALAKGEVQPDSQIPKLQQPDITVTTDETTSGDGEAALSSQAGLAAQSKAVNADHKATPASVNAQAGIKGQTPVADMSSESKVQISAITVDTAASEIIPQLEPAAGSDTESVEVGKNAQPKQGEFGNTVASAVVAAEKGNVLRSAEQPEPEKAAIVAKTEQTAAISKDNKNNVSGQSQTQQAIKVTAEQSAPNSQQQSNSQQQTSGQQFAAMLEQQNTPDSQIMPKAGPEVAAAVRLEPSFMQQLHGAEQRQHSSVSKGVAKTATEQLQQSLNLQQQDAASQLRQRVSLMVRQNIQVAEVRLDPAGLGQMQIKIDMQQDQAQVQFVVQQPQAKELLEQQLPRLRELLQQQGIVLTEGNVQQQSQQERQLAERNSQRGGTTAQGDDIAAEPDMPGTNVQISAKINDRLVDYYA